MSLADLFMLQKSAMKRILPYSLWSIASRFRQWISRSLWFTREDYCPALLPWFAFSAQANDLDRVHSLALHWASQEWNVKTAVAAAFWPIIALMRTISLTRMYGSYVATVHGVGGLHQFIAQLFLANRYNITARSYYIYRLFLATNWTKRSDFVQNHEICTLLPKLNAHNDSAMLDDKVRFYKEMTSLGLPTPPVVAVFDKDAVTNRYGERAPRLPRVDLVLKPSNRDSGYGVQCWVYDPSVDMWSARQRQWPEEELVREASIVAREGPCLLQVCVRNHQELRSLAGEGVCTVRAVTYRRREGMPRLLLATLRMPRGTSFVDNLSAGGIAAPIDPDDGSLGPAVAMDLRVGVLESHPDTEAPIKGRQLPFWKETAELAVTAHSCFPQFAFVGWDLIISDSGPLLLEANLTWGVNVCQLPHGVPLGETVFPEIFLDELSAQRPSLSRAEAASRVPPASQPGFGGGRG